MAKKGIILVEPVSNYIDGVPEIKTTDDYDYNVPLGLHAIERLEQHFPYAETPKDLENAGSQLKERDVEFTFSLSFHPDWIEQVCQLPSFLKTDIRFATLDGSRWLFLLPIRISWLRSHRQCAA